MEQIMFYIHTKSLTWRIYVRLMMSYIGGDFDYRSFSLLLIPMTVVFKKYFTFKLVVLNNDINTIVSIPIQHHR